MFTGTLIDELIATVERAEKHAHRTPIRRKREQAYWYTRNRARTSIRLENTWGGINGRSSRSNARGSSQSRRKPCWTGTPEIYFAKPIDNSRLVKIEDPRRSREMRQFGVALGCLFLLVMTYTWQHFKAIEYGYKIEFMKSERDGLTELNHALRLEEASLRSPDRIDRLARRSECNHLKPVR